MAENCCGPHGDFSLIQKIPKIQQRLTFKELFFGAKQQFSTILFKKTAYKFNQD